MNENDLKAVTITATPLAGSDVSDACKSLAELCELKGLKNGKTALYWHLLCVCTKHMVLRDEE